MPGGCDIGLGLQLLTDGILGLSISAPTARTSPTAAPTLSRDGRDAGEIAHTRAVAHAGQTRVGNQVVLTPGHARSYAGSYAKHKRPC